ncbi:MAG: ABC transporter permease [Candidatus Korarchaeota archaeon]|nr:ABC transporter permease [Candidatus Korarchaeota archaeon]
MHKVILESAAILTLLSLAVATASFVLVNLSPGDPLSTMGGDEPLPPDQVERLRTLYGLDRPLLGRYLDFLLAAPTLDYGVSMRFGLPVVEVLRGPILTTLSLVSLSVAASAASAWLLWRLGIEARGAIGRVVEGLAFSPSYAYAAAALVLAYWKLGVVSTMPEPTPGKLALVLTVATLSATPRLYLVFRRTVEEEFRGRGHLVTSLRAQGLSESVVRARLAAISAPSLATQVASQFALTLQAMVFVEPILGLPGLGFMLMEAVRSSDVPLLVGAFTAVGLASVMSNAAGHLAAGLLDPRLRGEWHG